MYKVYARINDCTEQPVSMERQRGAYDSFGIVYSTYADRKTLRVVKQLIQSTCLETFQFQGLLSL